MESTHRWKRLVLHAQGNHGVVSAHQAKKLGFSTDALARLCSNGRLERLFRGTYGLAGYPDTFTKKVAAACTFVGPGAYACARTAARLYELDGFHRERTIEILTSETRRPGRGHILCHRTNWLPLNHQCSVGGIPTTSIERTLIDLGSFVREEIVETAVDSACRKRLTKGTRLVAAVEETPRNGRKGPSVLRRLLMQRGEWVPTDSALETKMLRLLRRGGLPPPRIQRHQGSDTRHIGRVDFIYADDNLIIEVDGYRYHSSRAAWQNDLSRQNALIADGRRLLRFTNADIEQRPAEALALIKTFLGH